MKVKEGRLQNSEILCYMYLHFSKLFVFWSNAECFTLFDGTKPAFFEIKALRGLTPCGLVVMCLRCVSERPFAPGCILKHMESFFRPKTLYRFTKLHGITFLRIYPYINLKSQMFNVQRNIKQPSVHKSYWKCPLFSSVFAKF